MFPVQDGFPHPPQPVEPGRKAASSRTSVCFERRTRAHPVKIDETCSTDTLFPDRTFNFGDEGGITSVVCDCLATTMSGMGPASCWVTHKRLESWARAAKERALGTTSPKRQENGSNSTSSNNSLEVVVYVLHLRRRNLPPIACPPSFYDGCS